MAYRKQIDFSKLTVAQVADLNDYQLHRYKVWAEGVKKKKENRNNFNEYLKQSCSQYNR